MKEEVDNRNMLVKEVYARYGLAMYFAQCVERGLAILLTALEIGRRVKNRTEYDSFLDSNFEKTMGRLIKLLEKEMKVNHEQKKELEETLELRNYLAHNYFWFHAINFMNDEGCSQMVSELKSITLKLEKVNKTLQSITKVISRRYGITEEKLKKIEKDLLSK